MHDNDLQNETPANRPPKIVPPTPEEAAECRAMIRAWLARNAPKPTPPALPPESLCDRLNRDIGAIASGRKP